MGAKQRFQRWLHGEQYVVQLHRAVSCEGVPGWAIANSWQPIVVRGVDEARQTAHRLRRDNRWAGPGYWPHVTITDEQGNPVRETA